MQLQYDENYLGVIYLIQTYVKLNLFPILSFMINSMINTNTYIMDVYYENQRGGLCRLHALNAFFGERKYSDADFWATADKFDIEQKNKFGVLTSCKQFDLVNSDQRTLISYILRQHGIYMRYAAINKQHEHMDDAIAAGIFFVFNMDHIWIMKNKNDRWYKVDSIGGVRQLNIECVRREKNIGIMFPVDNLQNEFNRLANAITAEMAGLDAISFVRQCHKEKKILGNVEVLLGSIVELLDIQRSNRSEFAEVNQLINQYDKFAQIMYIQNRYNDLPFLETYVPGILTLVKRLSCIS